MGNATIDDRKVDTLPYGLHESEGRYLESADRDAQLLRRCFDVSPGRKAQRTGRGGRRGSHPDDSDDDGQNQCLHTEGIGTGVRTPLPGSQHLRYLVE